MRARLALVAACLLAVVSSMPVAAAAAPAPPAVTGVCATADDYFWSISAPAAANMFSVEYRASFEDWLPTTLDYQDEATFATIIATSRDAGTTLSARWAEYPDQVAASSAPNTTPCERATLTVTITIEGGTAATDEFPVAVRGAMPNPPWSVRSSTAVVSGVDLVLDPGSHVVIPEQVDIPAGYLWRETLCRDRTDDPNYPRLLIFLTPGGTEACEVTYHYGAILADSIAAGKVSGTDGFGISAITQPKGTWVTYLVRTHPRLAGKLIGIWRKVGSGAWSLVASRRIGTDGTLRYSMKLTATTGLQARWAGDGTYPAARARGRRAVVSTGAASLAVTCDEFTRATGDDGTATVRRETWVTSGSKITATLCENATTGFLWESPAYSRQFVSLVGHKSVGSGSGLVGAPGTAVWTFKALKPGQSTITLEYNQPWDGGMKRAWVFELVVHAVK